MPRDDGPELRDIATLVALHGILTCGTSMHDGAAGHALEIGRQVAEGLGEKLSFVPPGGTVYTEERIRRFKESFFSLLEGSPRFDAANRGEILTLWRAAWEQA